MSGRRTTLGSIVRTSLAAICATALALTVFIDGADAKTLDASGRFRSHTVSGADCTSAVDLCFTGHAWGTVHGQAEFAAESITPTSVPGVVVIVGPLVIHDPRGEFMCTEVTTLNTDLGGNGEFVFLCQITGGTGRYAGATGYLQASGTVSPKGISMGTYTGQIILP